MPTILDERIITLEFSDLAKRRPITRPDRPLARASGHHQSTILAHIARKIGVLKAGELDEEEYPILWALGNATEEYLVSLWPEIEWQPGEMTTDEISVNCDGISRPRDIPIALRLEYGIQIEEFKFTFKKVCSGQEFIDKQWMWMHQGREYCYQYGARRERWHILHVRGDYKSFGPVYKTYTVGFSDQDCVGTHAMLLANMKDVPIEVSR